MAAQLDAAEKQALQMFLKEPLNVQALKKLCAARESYYREQATNHLNTVPNDLHEKSRSDALATQYANVAMAWGRMFKEIEAAAQ